MLKFSQLYGFIYLVFRLLLSFRNTYLLCVWHIFCSLTEYTMILLIDFDAVSASLKVIMWDYIFSPVILFMWWAIFLNFWLTLLCMVHNSICLLLTLVYYFLLKIFEPLLELTVVYSFWVIFYLTLVSNYHESKVFNVLFSVKIAKNISRNTPLIVW